MAMGSGGGAYYLKDLNNMNIVKNEIKGLRNIISEVSAERDNAFVTLAQKDNALQKANARIAEYERIYGVLK